MATSDLFVVYDCVQFPRQGWVHRNKLTHQNGTNEWLTLPLHKTARDSTRIMDLKFTPNAQAIWEERLRAFPIITKNWNHLLVRSIRTLNESPLDFIEGSLRQICDMLGFTCRFERSSKLSLPPDLKSQDRILAIADHFKATHYTNAPGGRELYQPEPFTTHGIHLQFLPDYRGSFASILERLLTEPTDRVASDIRENI